MQTTTILLLLYTGCSLCLMPAVIAQSTSEATHPRHTVERTVPMNLKLGTQANPSRIELPSEAEILRARGFETTPDGLRQALTNSDYWVNVHAIRAIKERGDASFHEALLGMLQHERAMVRTEAAMALDRLGDAKGLAVLKSEVQMATKMQANLVAGKRKMDFFTDSDLVAALQAAEFLADKRDTSGFELVKTALLQNDHLGCKSVAARALAKFNQFKEQGVDVLPVLLQAADDTMKRMDERFEKNPNELYGPEGPILSRIMSGLQKTGDQRAKTKLQQISESKNPDARMQAKAKLDQMQ